MIEIRVSWYDPDLDQTAVVQDDYLDLKEAFVNGVVPGSIDFEDVPSNELDTPDKVGYKVTDRFAADRARKSIESRQASKSESPSQGDSPATE